jgi:hypothetical protein
MIMIDMTLTEIALIALCLEGALLIFMMYVMGGAFLGLAHQIDCIHEFIHSIMDGQAHFEALTEGQLKEMLKRDSDEYNDSQTFEEWDEPEE